MDQFNIQFQSLVVPCADDLIRQRSDQDRRWMERYLLDRKGNRTQLGHHNYILVIYNHCTYWIIFVESPPTNCSLTCAECRTVIHTTRENDRLQLFSKFDCSLLPNTITLNADKRNFSGLTTSRDKMAALDWSKEMLDDNESPNDNRRLGKYCVSATTQTQTHIATILLTIAS